MKDYNLAEEVQHNWTELLRRDCLFDRTTLETDLLKKLTMQEMKKFAREHLTTGGTCSRKLSIQVPGSKTRTQNNSAYTVSAEDATANNPHVYTSVTSFRSSCQWYPSSHITRPV